MEYLYVAISFGTRMGVPWVQKQPLNNEHNGADVNASDQSGRGRLGLPLDADSDSCHQLTGSKLSFPRLQAMSRYRTRLSLTSTAACLSANRSTSGLVRLSAGLGVCICRLAAGYIRISTRRRASRASVSSRLSATHKVSAVSTLASRPCSLLDRRNLKPSLHACQERGTLVGGGARC